MAGRIRTVKPEWLEHEKMASCSDAARVLSIALVLCADDHGNGRGADQYLASQAWAYSRDPREAVEKVRDALEELSGWFVVRYQFNGQTYFHLPGWASHQRVDKPGKPRVPGPPGEGARDTAGNPREDVEKARGIPGPDHDHDHDLERERETRARAREAEPVPRDAIVAIADRVWQAQEELRAELQAEGVGAGSRGLGLVHPAKGQLVARIGELAASRRVEADRLASEGWLDPRDELRVAEDACLHVLAVLAAEARATRSLRWLDGGHGRPERFAASLAQSPDEAAARAKVKRSEAVAKGQAPAGPYVPGGGAKILGGGLEALKRDELAGAGGGS